MEVKKVIDTNGIEIHTHKELDREIGIYLSQGVSLPTASEDRQTEREIEYKVTNANRNVICVKP